MGATAHSEINIPTIEYCVLLSESRATHKAQSAERTMGIPVDLAIVDKREPNKFWNTKGLVEAKHEKFLEGWEPTDKYLSGKVAVGVADVNTGSGIQGTHKYEEERKLKVNIENIDSFDVLVQKLSEQAATKARVFGSNDVVTRMENGVIFERRFRGIRPRSLVVTRGYITTPNNTLSDQEFVKDYLYWTGMREMHAGMPWGRDQLSWLAWIIKNKRTGNYAPNELVRLSKSVEKASMNPCDQDFEFYNKMGRFNEEWLQFVDCSTAFILLQMGTNFTKSAADALVGSLNKPRNGVRVIYQR